MKSKILILDDDRHVINLIRGILQKYDFEINWSRTCREAARHLRTNPCDLVVVDYRLPDGNGIDWMTNMRNEGCLIPFVFLSGFCIDRKAQNRMRNLLGVRFILEKPIDSIQFVEDLTIALTQPIEDIKSLFDCESRMERIKKLCSSSDILKEIIEECVDPEVEDCIWMEDKEEKGEQIEDDYDLFEKIVSEDRSEDEYNRNQTDVDLSEEETEDDFDLASYLSDVSNEDETGDPIVIDDDLEESLKELRLEYLKDIPNLLRDLADQIDKAAQSGWSTEEVGNAVMKAHNIKGSSGSHSLMAISEIAAILEDALERIEPEENSVMQSSSEVGSNMAQL